jgi:hypothetical protein
MKDLKTILVLLTTQLVVGTLGLGIAYVLVKLTTEVS